MSDTDSDSDNVGEYFKLPVPQTFKAYNAYHAQAFINNVPCDQELKPNSSDNDAVDSDTMAPCNVASCQYKMAPRIFSQGKGTLAHLPPRETDDLLAVRNPTIVAPKMAPQSMANNGGLLFEWNVETPDDPMETLQSAFFEGVSATQANVYGGTVLPQNGETARSTTPIRGVVNFRNKMVAHTGNKTAAERYKMVAGIGKKMTSEARYKMTTAGRNKMAPALLPRRCRSGSCYVVRVGSENVNWLQDVNMMFPTHSPDKCTYGNYRRRPVHPRPRPGLGRVTLQALCLMTLAIFLTYFAIHCMERYMHREN